MRVKLYAVAVALVASVALTGCSDKVRYECDKGDQLEFDADCGYWQNYQFNFYPWVVKGETSYSPEGFQPTPDDETAPVKEEKPSLPKPKVKTSKASIAKK